MASITKSVPADDRPKDESDATTRDENREKTTTDTSDSTSDKTSQPEKANCDEKMAKEGGHPHLPKGLPPIDLNELNALLRDPKMPSKKILHEVADKVISRGGDGSTGVREMKGLFDCILEVSLKQSQESDNSDDEEEDVSYNTQFPCDYCKKVFFSPMEVKTHILVLHSEEDQSLLNIKRQSSNECQKISQGHRNRSQELAKVGGDGKERQPQAPDAGAGGDENVPLITPKTVSKRSQSKMFKSEARAEKDNATKRASPGDDTCVSDVNSVTSSSLPASAVDLTRVGSQSTGSLQSSSSSTSSPISSGDSMVVQADGTSRLADKNSTSTAECDSASSGLSEADTMTDSTASRKRESPQEEEEAPSAAKRGRRSSSKQDEARQNLPSRRSSRSSRRL